MLKWRHTFSRRIIKTALWPGPVGFPGRWYGRRLGYPLDFGIRLYITNPWEYMQNAIITDGVYEPAIARILVNISMCNGVFIDIGANIGQYSTLMAHQGMTVHAFEPVPRLARQARANARLNHLESRVNVFEKAISNANGLLCSFYVADRADDGSHSLIEGVPATHVDRIDVQTITLDEHVQITGVQRVDVIKIDVEGAESLVLDGSEDVLNRFQPVVVIETADRLAEAVNESAVSALDRLFRRGYSVFLINELSGKLFKRRRDEITGTLANYFCLPPSKAFMLSRMPIPVV